MQQATRYLCICIQLRELLVMLIGLQPLLLLLLLHFHTRQLHTAL